MSTTHLVTHLPGLLSEGVVLLLVADDVLLVPQRLHVLELLVGELQLLLVVLVLLHLGLKVPQLLLGGEDRGPEWQRQGG